MTDLVASSETGNDESPQIKSDVVVASSNNDGDAEVAVAAATAEKDPNGRGGGAGGGGSGGGGRKKRTVDEEGVIHFAAAAKELLASTAPETKKKRMKKVKKRHNMRKGPAPVDPSPPPPPERQQRQKEEEEAEEEKDEQQHRSAKKLSTASAAATTATPKKDLTAEAIATTTTTATTTAAAAATTITPSNTASLAKEGEGEGEGEGGGEGEGEGETVYPGPSDKKKRRKKKNRQTSQEEESAQALLALNKGGLGSPNGAAAAENEQDGDTTPSKKRKPRSKAYRVEAVAEARREGATTPAPANPGGGDVDMIDALSEPLTNPTSSSSLANSNDSDCAADPSNAPQALEIPDQRIITEHLAAHMAKIGPPEPQPEDVLVEQRLVTELSSITQQTIGADGFMAGETSQKQPSRSNSSAKKKRRRQPDSNGSSAGGGGGANNSMSGLVDPQLMQLDHDAALAAGETLPSEDPNPSPRKRRRPTNAASAGARSPPQELGDAAQVPIDGLVLEVGCRKAPPQPSEGRPGWGTTPSEPINGGTFSLEERHTIDKALADYCKTQNMTMDELKDRVWGNNRRKDEFWDTICLSVPNRSRASVYKHVRRSCHIFQQRAKWTAEEDDELAELVKEKGNRWKDIGEAMGRMGEDCRDRYRNYVKCGKSRGTDRWTEEEEDLLKRVVRDHKEQARQEFIQKNKPLPPPDEEDTVLINWTTVSEMMQNKRSRIQCRYKWKKMLVQKEKVKQAPIGVTYVGGKKKRLTFDIKHMLPGDRQWLLYQIRDSGATQENEIPWDQFAKNDKDVGIWTHRDLKNAYKGFRSHIPHKRRPLVEIVRQLINELERFSPESLKMRFIPSTEGEASASAYGHHQLHHQHQPPPPPPPPPPQKRQSSASHTPTPGPGPGPGPGPASHRTPAEFETQLFQVVPTAPVAPVAPVANMGPTQQPTQPASDIIVDPSLVGQGMDLQKVAGEALNAHSNGLREAMQQQQDGEDESERELRKQLGGYIQGSDLGAATSGPA